MQRGEQIHDAQGEKGQVIRTSARSTASKPKLEEGTKDRWLTLDIFYLLEDTHLGGCLFAVSPSSRWSSNAEASEVLIFRAEVDTRYGVNMGINKSLPDSSHRIFPNPVGPLHVEGGGR